LETKICGRCKVEKDISLFPIRRASDDGRLRYCKECHNAYLKEYRKTERFQKYRREYYLKNKKYSDNYSSACREKLKELIIRYIKLYNCKLNTNRELIKHNEMARLIGIDPSVFYRWRNGETKITDRETLKKFRRVLEKLEKIGS